MKQFKRTFGISLLLAAIGATPLRGETATPTKPGFTLADLKAQIPQGNDGTFLMELPEILNTATDKEVPKLLDGQSVATSGQVIRGKDDNSLHIFRYQLSCCAEHARHCSVTIEFRGKVPTFKENAWISVTGTISYRQENGKTVPFIIAREIKEVTPPANAVLK